MSYIGAIDQGTSSSRFCLFDKAGALVAVAAKEFKNHYPQPGWCEHDPMEILETVYSCIEQITKDYPASSIEAIGITNQRETTVVWDKITGKPLHNAIVWLDTRTRSVVETLTAKHGSADAFRAKVGLPISTYFSGLKLLWLIENVPAIAEAVANGTALFGTIDTWLIWNLTGNHSTSVCNASRTFLMNINSRTWDESVLSELKIPKAMLPDIKSNSEDFGSVRTGPLAGKKITGVLGDQQSALLGQQCLESGQAKNTYGTGCFMLLNTGPTAVQSNFGLLTTVAFQLGPDSPCLYALEGSVAIAGMGVEWLRDNLEMIKSSKEMDPLVSSLKDNDGVYIVPAFSGLLSPYWRPDARGVITGLTLQSTKAHLARAILEATAYQSKDVLLAMINDSAAQGKPLQLQELRVDGGMTANMFLMQFQADQLGIKVARPDMTEATAAGAAYAAGLAVGYWKSIEDLQTCTAKTNTFTIFERKASQDDVDLNYRGWKRAVNKSLNLAGEPPANQVLDPPLK